MMSGFQKEELFMSSMRRSLAVLLAWSGWMAIGGSVRGGEPTSAGDAEAPAADSPVSEEPSRPLMGLLSRTSLSQPLHDARVNIYGWIEGSYQYNFSVPAHTPNVGRAFDVFENNKGYLNQLDLTFERKVNLSNHAWDVAGRLDITYGSDSRFTTSSDLLSQQSSIGANGVGREEAWLDIPQAYVDVNVPFGQPVRIRIGKFELFKTIDPNVSATYTHPFEYGQAFPYTLTGISAYTSLTPAFSIEMGLSRGWDQTLTDNNSAAVDGFGRLVWNASDSLQIFAAFITGPEQYHDNVHFTTTSDLAFVYTPVDQFALVLDITSGHQSGAKFGDFPGSNSPPPMSDIPVHGANWYGVTGTSAYKLSNWMTLNSRVEWYRDEEGYTEGFPGQLNLYEATIGLKLTPFHSTSLGDYFVLRPELRYDYSSRPCFNIDKPRHDQITVAIDAILNF
jgi:hypothetical protein